MEMTIITTRRSFVNQNKILNGVTKLPLPTTIGDFNQVWLLSHLVHSIEESRLNSVSHQLFHAGFNC